MTTTSLRTNKPSSTPAHVSTTSTSVMSVEPHVKAAAPTSRGNKHWHPVKLQQYVVLVETMITDFGSRTGKSYTASEFNAYTMVYYI